MQAHPVANGRTGGQPQNPDSCWGWVLNNAHWRLSTAEAHQIIWLVKGLHNLTTSSRTVRLKLWDGAGASWLVRWSSGWQPRVTNGSKARGQALLQHMTTQLWPATGCRAHYWTADKVRQLRPINVLRTAMQRAGIQMRATVKGRAGQMTKGREGHVIRQRQYGTGQSTPSTKGIVSTQAIHPSQSTVFASTQVRQHPYQKVQHHPRVSL